jgi:ribosomal protein S27AE
MADFGWVSIRKLPNPSQETSKRNELYIKALENFFSKFKICSKCNGKGYQTKKTLPVITTNVRFRGIDDLEDAHERKDPPFSDLVREVLSIELEGRKPCPRCKGERFIAK